MITIWGAAFASIVVCTPAIAQQSVTTIAALGASQTYGMGVSRNQAYPAQLERLLKAAGYRVRVVNLGRNGDTTAGMMARLGSVPRDARIVILQPGGNDWRQGGVGERQGNIDDIESRLQGQGIRVIKLENNVFRGLERGPDGQHLSPAGYLSLAESLEPQVEGMLVGQ